MIGKNKNKDMKKIIKAWAIVNKDEGYLTKEASPNFGRYWIFETRKQAREEQKRRFYNSPRKNLDKIIKIELKP